MRLLMTYAVLAMKANVGLLAMRSRIPIPQWNSRKIQTAPRIPIFQFYVFGKPVPASKNAWDNRLISKIQRKFPEIELFQEREDGLIFGNLDEGKHVIMFKGATPSAAVEDLREMVNMVDLLEQQRVAAKIDALADFIAHHMLGDQEE